MKKLINAFGRKLEQINEIRAEYQKQQKAKKKKISTPKVKDNTQVLRIEIATSTVIKVLLIVFLLFALKEIMVELKSMLIIAGFSFFLAMGLAPFVDGLERYHIPRPLAILILYIGFLGMLGLLFVKVIPIISDQLTDISYDLRGVIASGKIEEMPLVTQLMERTNFDPAELQAFISENISSIAGNLQDIAGSTIGILLSIFQSVFNLLFALVLMFFILLERESIIRFVLLMFPAGNRDYVQAKFETVQSKMAEWFKGQFILMVCMGTFMYAGMKIFEMMFGMKYAVTIGLVAAVMELFPYVGVLLTGLLCVLVALNISFVLVIAVLLWIALAQFLEGNVLVPMVMQKVVGLSSVVVILAVATGGILGSAFGGVPLAIICMIFAVPVAASIAIFVEEYLNRGN